MTELGEACGNLGEEIPDVTLVPTISLKCKPALSSSDEALTAGVLGVPGEGEMRSS